MQTKLQRIAFPFAGNKDSIKIKLMNDRPADFESIITYKKDQDSLRYWYRPEVKQDSLIFEVGAGASKLDTFYLRKRPLKPDSLAFNALSRGTLKLGDPFAIESTIPVVAIDSSKILITKADSLKVDFKTELFPEKSSFQVDFETEESSNYQITFLPEALTDFWNDQWHFVLRSSNQGYRRLWRT